MRNAGKMKKYDAHVQKKMGQKMIKLESSPHMFPNAVLDCLPEKWRIEGLARA